MSWKERRTVTILTTVVLVLASLLLIVLGIRYRQHRALNEAEEDAAAAADPTAPDSVYTALTYSNGSTTLSFSLGEDGVWRWDADTSFPLDETTVKSILAQLTGWKPQQILRDQESLDAAELSESTGSLSATAAKGGATTLLFGKATTDGTSCYVRLNGDETTVYIIDNTIQGLMSVPIYDMCLLPELPVLAESDLRSVTVQGPAPAEEGAAAQVTTLTNQSGDAVSWRANGANVTDDQLVRGLMEDLTSFQVSKCVDYAPSDEAADICGFGAPQAILRLLYTQNGQDGEVLLTIGNQPPDQSGRYVRIGEEAPIYLMQAELLDPLMRIAAEGLEG